jgi:serine/threonine-protein kinase
VFFVALALAAPILVGLTAREAYLRTSLPDIGLDVDAQLGVEARDARWTGVMQRDRIVAVDGVPVTEPADWIARALDGGPRELAVTFERDGARFTVRALSRPLAWIDRGAVFARVATAAILMALGLLVYMARPGVTVTWLMLLLSWDLGAFLLVKIGLWWDPRLVKEATVFPWTIACAVGLHLASVFPERIPWLASRRRVALLYGPLVAAPFIQAFHLVTQMSLLGTAYAAVAMVFVVVVIAAQFRRVRRSNDARARAQYRALMVGFAIGLVVPAVWNTLRISLDIWNSPWAAHYNALPMVVFIGVLAYAIVRHNALAIDRFTAAIVGYGITTIVIGGAFAGALVAIPLLLGTSGLGESPGLLVATTALTFASFAPGYRRIKRWVDRRFFRDQAGASEIADALRDLVVAMQNSSRDDATSAAFSAAAILHGDRVELWTFEPEAKQLRLERRDGAGPEHPPAIPLDGPLGKALASGTSGGVAELAPRALDATAQDELWAHELAMIAPVMVRGIVAGFVAVGRKRSGAGYSIEELSLLTIIGAQLGAARERTETESRIDRYHLERRLGTGGMAEVFLAWQVGPGGFERKVALKRPLPHVSEDSNAVAAFLDEARLAAQLVHPHIARVYDVGERSGSYYIVMEYVDGPSLREVLRDMAQQAKKMPPVIAVAIMIDVLSALDHAHHACDERGREMRLVHRDVSPRNILLTRAGQPKLVDFGIARAQFQLHVTRTGIVKGTLPYMSPEQATDQELDHRADLYSAAVVLYELITGEMAYPKGPAAKRPKPASPAALDQIIRRATEASPAQRHASAAELAEAIAAVVPPATPDEVVAFLSAVSPVAMAGDTPAIDDDAPASAAHTVIEVPFGVVGKSSAE